jgi:hypothetical protein
MLIDVLHICPKVALTFVAVVKHTRCFRPETTNKKLNNKIFIKENNIRM